MIDYVKGSIAELTPTDVVIETGNIGYRALISLQTYSALDRRSEGMIYVHHILREDEELYYGFATKDERELFRLIISVSGVGAATARMMLSSLTCEEIRAAILSEDVVRIKSVKGLGVKTAQRLIIELKDKITKGAGMADSTSIFAAQSGVADEASTALVMLGFTKAAVAKAVAAVLKADPSAAVETVIKKALRML